MEMLRGKMSGKRRKITIKECKHAYVGSTTLEAMIIVGVFGFATKTEGNRPHAHAYISKNTTLLRPHHLHCPLAR